MPYEKKNFFMPHLFLFSLQLHFWNFLLEISIWNRGFKTERRTLKNDRKNEDWNVLSFRRPAILKRRVGRERMIKELNISFLLLGLLFSASSFRLRKSSFSNEDSMLSNVWNLPTFGVWFIDLVWVSIIPVRFYWFKNLGVACSFIPLRWCFEYVKRFKTILLSLSNSVPHVKFNVFYHRVHWKVFWIQRELFLVKPEIDLIGFEAF